MKLNEFLKHAKSLISDPDNWTKGNSARDAMGRPCRPTESKAKSFCVSGVLSRTWMKDNNNHIVLAEAIGTLLSVTQDNSSFLSIFNDRPGTTHSDVMDLFDRAIKKAESA